MNFEAERRRLVEHLVRRKYITKHEVIKAMGKIPRHEFVPPGLRKNAYVDSPQQIGFGQTISAPHMVGIMAEKLDIEKGQNILEIGGGSGYHAAVFAEIVGKEGHIYSVEYVEALAERARENIRKCGLENIVTILEGDGSLGLKEHAPYDRIFVSCAAPMVPEPLLEQLKDKGKLLIPVGSMYYQTLILLEKKGGKLKEKEHGGCVFVPLRGTHGFK
jgi:protein-L-isoaspartate(D-aspartate) O-methyltransferase